MNERIDVAGEAEMLVLECPSELGEDYVLSPYVVSAHGGGYEMLVRLVNRDDDPQKKIARIYRATSSDGLRFSIEPQASLAPDGTGADDAGCEDATIVRTAGGVRVYYSGYSRETKASMLLAASGPDLRRLAKTGPVLPDETFANAKEAALIDTGHGFRLFFEYARDGASLIGVAHASVLEGPWSYGESGLGQRADRFDAWHLSPSSALALNDGRHVLFYNGSTKKVDWRVGWALLSEDARSVVVRCERPLIAPIDVKPGDTDIAFAASALALDEHTACVYYSISDRRLYRQRIRLNVGSPLRLYEAGTAKPVRSSIAKSDSSSRPSVVR